MTGCLLCGSAPVSLQAPGLDPPPVCSGRATLLRSSRLSPEAVMPVAWDHTAFSSLCSRADAKAKVTCLLRAGPAAYPG